MPRAQARAELIWPLVGGLENHATPLPTDQDLLRRREAAGFGKPDRLTPAVLKQLRAGTSHTSSLDVRLYRVKMSVWIIHALLSAERQAVKLRAQGSRVLALVGQPAWA